MTSSTMMWAGVLGAAGLKLLWWDLVDFVLDRVGPPPQRPADAHPVSEQRRDARSRASTACTLSPRRPAPRYDRKVWMRE